MKKTAPHGAVFFVAFVVLLTSIQEKRLILQTHNDPDH